MPTVLLIANKIPHYRVSVYNYLARRFRDCGWEFEVASDKLLRETNQELKFKFHEVSFQFSQYRKLVNTVKPDVVIVHLHLKIPMFWPLIHWLKLKRIPLISWTKGANLDKAESKLRQALFNHTHRLSNALVMYSPNERDRVPVRHRHKIFVANNTVNFEDYPEVKATKEDIKAEFKIPFQKMVLFAGTMGVDGERKKVDHLIEIFRELDRPDVGLVLVGRGLSEERKAKLNPKNTLYVGSVHDPDNLQISKLFKAADVFAIPGHVGLSLNQAFYWGLPVVTEAGCHPPEIHYLKHGRNGFMVQENNIAELRGRILLLLDDERLRGEFSRCAQEDIHKQASIEGMFEAFFCAVKCVFTGKNITIVNGRIVESNPTSTSNT